MSRRNVLLPPSKAVAEAFNRINETIYPTNTTKQEADIQTSKSNMSIYPSGNSSVFESNKSQNSDLYQQALEAKSNLGLLDSQKSSTALDALLSYGTTNRTHSPSPIDRSFLSHTQAADISFFGASASSGIPGICESPIPVKENSDSNSSMSLKPLIDYKLTTIEDEDEFLYGDSNSLQEPIQQPKMSKAPGMIKSMFDDSDSDEDQVVKKVKPVSLGAKSSPKRLIESQANTQNKIVDILMVDLEDSKPSVSPNKNVSLDSKFSSKEKTPFSAAANFLKKQSDSKNNLEIQFPKEHIVQEIVDEIDIFSSDEPEAVTAVDSISPTSNKKNIESIDLCKDSLNKGKKKLGKFVEHPAELLKLASSGENFISDKQSSMPYKKKYRPPKKSGYPRSRGGRTYFGKQRESSYDRKHSPEQTPYHSRKCYSRDKRFKDRSSPYQSGHHYSYYDRSPSPNRQKRNQRKRSWSSSSDSDEHSDKLRSTSKKKTSNKTDEGEIPENPPSPISALKKKLGLVVSSTSTIKPNFSPKIKLDSSPTPIIKLDSPSIPVIKLDSPSTSVTNLSSTSTPLKSAGKEECLPFDEIKSQIWVLSPKEEENLFKNLTTDVLELLEKRKTLSLFGKYGDEVYEYCCNLASSKVPDVDENAVSAIPNVGTSQLPTISRQQFTNPHLMSSQIPLHISAAHSINSQIFVPQAMSPQPVVPIGHSIAPPMTLQPGLQLPAGAYQVHPMFSQPSLSQLYPSPPVYAANPNIPFHSIYPQPPPTIAPFTPVANNLDPSNNKFSNIKTTLVINRSNLKSVPLANTGNVFEENKNRSNLKSVPQATTVNVFEENKKKAAPEKEKNSQTKAVSSSNKTFSETSKFGVSKASDLKDEDLRSKYITERNDIQKKLQASSVELISMDNYQSKLKKKVKMSSNSADKKTLVDFLKKYEKKKHEHSNLIEDAKNIREKVISLEAKMRLDSSKCMPKESSDTRSKKEKEEIKDASPASNTFAYSSYDTKDHWCHPCGKDFTSIQKMLDHLHSTEHIKIDPYTVTTVETPSENLKGQPIFGPVKGVEFLKPMFGFYCELCKEMLSSYKHAEKHIKGHDHAINYKEYIKKYPVYEKKIELMKTAKKKIIDQERFKRETAETILKHKERLKTQAEANQKVKEKLQELKDKEEDLDELEELENNNKVAQKNPKGWNVKVTLSEQELSEDNVKSKFGSMLMIGKAPNYKNRVKVADKIKESLQEKQKRLSKENPKHSLKKSVPENWPTVSSAKKEDLFENVSKLQSSSEKVPKFPSAPEKVPTFPSAPEKVPKFPSAPEKVPTFPSAPEKVPKLPSVSEKVPKLPSASEKVPKLPCASEKVPKLPSASEKVSKLPSASEKVPKLPRASEKVPKLPRASVHVPKIENISMTTKSNVYEEKSASTVKSQPSTERMDASTIPFPKAEVSEIQVKKNLTSVTNIATSKVKEAESISTSKQQISESIHVSDNPQVNEAVKNILYGGKTDDPRSAVERKVTQKNLPKAAKKVPQNPVPLEYSQPMTEEEQDFYLLGINKADMVPLAIPKRPPQKLCLSPGSIRLPPFPPPLQVPPPPIVVSRAIDTSVPPPLRVPPPIVHPQGQRSQVLPRLVSQPIHHEDQYPCPVEQVVQDKICEPVEMDIDPEDSETKIEVSVPISKILQETSDKNSAANNIEDSKALEISPLDKNMKDLKTAQNHLVQKEISLGKDYSQTIKDAIPENRTEFMNESLIDAKTIVAEDVSQPQSMINIVSESKNNNTTNEISSTKQECDIAMDPNNAETLKDASAIQKTTIYSEISQSSFSDKETKNTETSQLSGETVMNVEDIQYLTLKSIPAGEHKSEELPPALKGNTNSINNTNLKLENILGETVHFLDEHQIVMDTSDSVSLEKPLMTEENSIKEEILQCPSLEKEIDNSARKNTNTQSEKELGLSEIAHFSNEYQIAMDTSDSLPLEQHSMMEGNSINDETSQGKAFSEIINIADTEDVENQSLIQLQIPENKPSQLLTDLSESMFQQSIKEINCDNSSSSPDINLNVSKTVSILPEILVSTNSTKNEGETFNITGQVEQSTISTLEANLIKDDEKTSLLQNITGAVENHTIAGEICTRKFNEDDLKSYKTLQTCLLLDSSTVENSKVEDPSAINANLVSSEKQVFIQDFDTEICKLAEENVHSETTAAMHSVGVEDTSNMLTELEGHNQAKEMFLDYQAMLNTSESEETKILPLEDTNKMYEASNTALFDSNSANICESKQTDKNITILETKSDFSVDSAISGVSAIISTDSEKLHEVPPNAMLIDSTAVEGESSKSDSSVSNLFPCLDKFDTDDCLEGIVLESSSNPPMISNTNFAGKVSSENASAQEKSEAADILKETRLGEKKTDSDTDEYEAD